MDIRSGYTIFATSSASFPSPRHLSSSPPHSGYMKVFVCFVFFLLKIFCFLPTLASILHPPSVPPALSNDTLTFSGSHSYSMNGVRRTTGFSFDADLNQLVAHGAGGLFITYKAKCKDILYQGLPKVRRPDCMRCDGWSHGSTDLWRYL